MGALCRMALPIRRRADICVFPRIKRSVGELPAVWKERGVSRRGVQVGVVRRLPIYETQTGGGMEVLVNVS